MSETSDQKTMRRLQAAFEKAGMAEADAAEAFERIVARIEYLEELNAQLLEALKLIARSDEFMDGTFALELQEIARAVIAKAKGENNASN